MYHFTRKAHNFSGFLTRKVHARENLNLILFFWQVVSMLDFSLLLTVVHWEGHVPRDQ